MRFRPNIGHSKRQAHITRRGLGLSLVTGLVASLGITIGVLSPSSPAAAIDIVEFVEVNGIFDNPRGEDGNTPPCLQYRADGVNVSQANQSLDPAILNEVRFGDGAGAGCGPVNVRSGFGFAGVSTSGNYSSLFELGRFTHYNNPIQANANNVGTVDLEASFVFRDLTDDSLITLNPVYLVTLDETPNDANPCAYPDGPNGSGCADRIVIEQPVPVTVTVGETTFTISIGGFGAVDPATGECDLGSVVPGNTVLTPEGGATTFCVYGAVAQSTLVIDKTSLGGDATYDFTYQEHSQQPGQVGAPIAGSQMTEQVTTTGGSGTSGPLTLEPGIYTLDEVNLPAGVVAGDFTCTSDTDASPYTTVDGVEYLDFDSGEAITCSITNTYVATITVVKDAQPDAAQDFAFTTTGGGGLPAAFSLDDDADDTLPNSVTFVVDPGDYTVTEEAVADWQLADLTCTVGDFADDDVASQSVTDATATVHVGLGDSVTCTYTNAATAQLVLEKTWRFARQGDAATLTADVAGDGSVDDTLVSTAGATMPQTDTDATPLTFVLGDSIDLAEVVDPSENYISSLECRGSDDAGVAAAGSLDAAPDGRSGTLVTNAASAAIGGTVTCTFTNLARPNVTIDKQLAGDPVVNADGSWTVGYDLTVANASDVGPGSYDLYDTFDFGAGVTIVAGSATVANAAPGTIVTQADFDGVGNTSIVQNQAIDPGATHAYTVTVDVDIAVGPSTDGDCARDGDEGTGLLNTMSIVVPGQEIPPVEACGEFAMLTLVKEVVNDDGGNAAAADFTLNANGPTPISGSSGTAEVSRAVLVGDYTLSETQIAGYSTDGFGCQGAAQDGATVTLAAGDAATCTIVNDDEPIDLELTKTDGGFEAVAGGEPIPYTITVRNIGARGADLGEAVTVTDELPAPLSWNSYPANCSAAGQVLTCDIDPALLPAGGAVVIEVLVDVAPDAPSGVFENKAWVTTDDDPVCEGDECTPPPCPALDNNNVDCEETPLERFASVFITKTDDVADGTAVQLGGAFSYELVAGNLGPSTVLANLVIDDDLPAQLSFGSISADARWSCNAADPIECTWTGGPVYPGETLPPITVNVVVNDDATGTEIYNVAVVTALVDTFPDVPADVGEIVTAQDDETTPLAVDGDLAIVKNASVTQVGASGGFNWVLDITNNGPNTAIDVVVGDVVPNSVKVTGVRSAHFSCSNAGNSVTCTRASMAVGATGRVIIEVTVPSGSPAGIVENVGTVESATPDSDLTNNSDDASVTIVAQAAPPTTQPVILPPTGSDAPASMVQMGTLLVGLGAMVMLITRRRRQYGSSLG
jgi:uncharacterized repeat protein (TIGR01451 family)